MSYRILAINPGSTSTKIAVYEDETPVFSLSLQHSSEDLAHFKNAGEQHEWRRDLVLNALAENNIDIKSLHATIGRGGLIHPVESGTYEVNDELRYDLLNSQRQHASNLGGLIARDIADQAGIKAYIADPVVVDELIPYARITGLPDIPRVSILHALNQKAVARRYAQEIGANYEDLDLIVCHMGGGCSIGAHRHGRVIDTNNGLNGDGPFTPERAGTLPTGQLVELCYSGKYTREEMLTKIQGQGGLQAHLGTTSVPDILEKIDEGDLHSMLILRAMCYTTAKVIGEMAVALKGHVDAILLTGGIAYSKRLTDFIASHIDFIAPIYVYPGENELESLAMNALAVLTGEREAHQYTSEQDNNDPAQINNPSTPSKLREVLRNLVMPSPSQFRRLTAMRRYFRNLRR
jgi:butyrate kinase